MANNQYKVEIPRNPTELIALLSKVATKHAALGAASPLTALKWGENLPKLAEAKAQDQLSDDFHRQAEKATGERDKYVPAITEFIRSIRDVLLGIYRDNPDALGDFGFKVSDSSSAPAPAPTPPAK